MQATNGGVFCWFPHRLLSGLLLRDFLLRKKLVEHVTREPAEIEDNDVAHRVFCVLAKSEHKLELIPPRCLS